MAAYSSGSCRTDTGTIPYTHDGTESVKSQNQGCQPTENLLIFMQNGDFFDGFKLEYMVHAVTLHPSPDRFYLVI